MPDGLMVTLADIRACGYCARGARQWFAAHGLDWGVFIASGLPAEILLATSDDLAARAVDAAIQRMGHG